MGWQRRGNGLYYTRSKRVAGKVTRIYVGKGPEAQIAAALDAERSAQRRAFIEARRVMLAHLNSLDDPSREFNAWVEILTDAAMLAAGYHQHDRGPWVKRWNYG